MISTGATSGAPTAHLFDCNRAAGTCTSTYPLLKPTVPLADITGVALATQGRGLGRGGHVETQSFIELKLKDSKELAITPATADAATVAQYSAEVAQIQAFLRGSAPTVSAASTFRDSAAESSNSRTSGILGTLLAIAAIALVLRWKPGARAKMNTP